MRKKFTEEELTRIYTRMVKCVPHIISVPQFANAYGLTVSSAYKVWRFGESSKIGQNKHRT